MESSGVNMAGIESGSSEITRAGSDLHMRTEQEAVPLGEAAATLDEITVTVARQPMVLSRHATRGQRQRGCGAVWHRGATNRQANGPA